MTGRKLGWSVALMLAFTVGELAAGLVAQSLALVSDAGHNFADVLALLLSWYALRAANWPSTHRKTYGYHRVGILAALANAASLVAIAGFIAFEAIGRLARQSDLPRAPLMIGVATAAVLVNGLVAFSLHAPASHDLNVRGAYLHMLGDALSAAGVVVAGIIVALTGSALPDPIVSLLIAAMILYSSWGILRESVNVLLEGAPAGVDMPALEKAIARVDGVIEAHDLHVWTVGAGVIACSCHVRVAADQSVREGQCIIRAVAQELHDHFRINHTTIQLEVEGCEPADMYCTVKPQAEGVCDHDHASHAH